MKPHLYKRRGMWHCRARPNSRGIVTVGYTPLHAYEIWRAFY